MSRPLTREEALRVLQLPGTAGPADAKQAYRRLARHHHPDVGGDGRTFHMLQRAYERLADEPAGDAPPRVSRGQPSRSAAAWTSSTPVDPTPVDLDAIDWDATLGAGDGRLDRDALAVHLARGETPLVHPLTATSRAPGSRLNAYAHHLSGDLTAHLRIEAGLDDRRRPVVVLDVHGGGRRARRALDRCSLDDSWVRLRGSSATHLRSMLTPSAERRATAVRTATHLERLLDRLAWPLDTWVALR